MHHVTEQLRRQFGKLYDLPDTEGGAALGVVWLVRSDRDYD